MTTPIENVKINISIVGFGQSTYTETVDESISNTLKQYTEYYFPSSMSFNNHFVTLNDE
jgi:hypothetical protein